MNASFVLSRDLGEFKTRRSICSDVILKTG